MPKNEIFQTKNLVRLALVAALYAALTLALPGLSFPAIQFRFSEILVLLCFYRKDYSISLILGCFIANCFSPMALMDFRYAGYSYRGHSDVLYQEYLVGFAASCCKQRNHHCDRAAGLLRKRAARMVQHADCWRRRACGSHHYRVRTVQAGVRAQQQTDERDRREQAELLQEEAG